MNSFFDSVRTLVGVIVGFCNSQLIQLLKRLGILQAGVYSFCEDMESSEEYNVKFDKSGQKNVPFKFHVETKADLVKFLNPVSEGFLTWEFSEGSYVDLLGVAEHQPIEKGYIKLVPYKSLIYEFYFTGNDGKRYRYYGSKNLRQLNQLKAWTHLKGEVTEVESGKKVLDSLTFFGKDSFISALIPFLLSMRIR